MEQVATNQGYVNTRKPLHIGDIRYLCGAATKVKVIGNVDEEAPLCDILEVARGSKYKVGDRVRIARRCLYPRHGR